MSKIDDAIREINGYTIFSVFMIIASYAFASAFSEHEILALVGQYVFFAAELLFAVGVSLIILLGLFSCLTSYVIPRFVSRTMYRVASPEESSQK